MSGLQARPPGRYESLVLFTAQERALAVVDQHLRSVWVRPSILELVDAHQDDVAGRHARQLFARHGTGPSEALLRQARDEGVPVTTELLAGPGQPAVVTVFPFVTDDGATYLGIVEGREA